MLLGLAYETDKLINIDINDAIIFHCINIFMFTLGGAFFYLKNKRMPRYKAINLKLDLKPSFFILAYFFLALGVIATTSQISSTTEYFFNLDNVYNSEIREDYLRSSADGGVSGIVKMFSISILTIYLLTFSLINFTGSKDKRLITLNKVSILCLLFKIAISLDRISIIAILLPIIYIQLSAPKIFTRKNILFFLIFIFIFILADLVSEKRLENTGIVDFILLYSKLGLTNFQLMIETVQGHTYGFSTFLSPLTFVGRTFDLSTSINSYYQWEWNPAQYFSSYLFQDFGYFSVFFMLLIGYLVASIDRSFKLKKNINIIGIYFTIMYGVISFITVPVIRGVEFWLSLLITILILKLTTSITKHENSIR